MKPIYQHFGIYSFNLFSLHVFMIFKIGIGDHNFAFYYFNLHFTVSMNFNIAVLFHYMNMSILLIHFRVG